MLKSITKNSFLIIICLLSSNIAISMEGSSTKKQKVIKKDQYNILKDINFQKRILKNVEISSEINLEKICRETSLTLLSAYHVAKNSCELPESIYTNTLELVQFIKDMLHSAYKDQKAARCIIKLAGQYFFSSPKDYKPEIELVNRALNEAIIANHQRAIDLILIFKNKISVNKLNIRNFCQSRSLTLLAAYNIAKSHNLNIDNLNLPDELKDLIQFIRSILNSKYKNYKAVKCIIKLKIDPEYKPSQKLLDRSLLEAAIACNAKAVELLIAKGANTNFKIAIIYNEDEPFYTPLRCTRSIAVAQILLANGANANANHPRDDFIVYTTPLMEAIEDNDIELVKLLLKHGADVNAYNNDYDKFVVNYACSNNIRNKLRNLILTHKDIINYVDPEDQTTHLMSAAIGSLSISNFMLNFIAAETLIKNSSADIINAKDNYGYTALMRAVTYGQIIIVELLLNYKADIFLKNNKGETALTIANKKYKEAVKSKNAFAGFANQFNSIIEILENKEDEIFENMPELVSDETKTREAEENYLSKLRTANSYEILEIKPNASQREIKEAFNRLSHEWHPDRNQSPYSAEIFRLIYNAYKRLKSEK